MNSEDIKHELVKSHAAAILNSTLSAKDNLVRSLSTVSMVAIPAYISLLNVFKDNTPEGYIWLKVAPVVLYLLVLVLCFYILFPRKITIDFSRPTNIIENHHKAIDITRKVAIICCILEILGFVAAASIFFI